MCLWVQVHAYLDIGMVGAWVGGRMGKQTRTLFWLNHVRGKRRPHDTQLRRASAGIVREQERFLTKLQRSRCTAPGEMGHTALSQKPPVLLSPPSPPSLVRGAFSVRTPARTHAAPRGRGRALRPESPAGPLCRRDAVAFGQPGPAASSDVPQCDLAEQRLALGSELCVQPRYHGNGSACASVCHVRW